MSTVGKPLLAALLLAGLAARLPAAAPDEAAPATSNVPRQMDSETPSADSPRAMLQLFGMDHNFWQSFVDGRSLDAGERENLLRLLYRLQQFAPGLLSQAAQPPAAWQELAADPARFRGEVFSGQGRLQRATREPLTPEEKQRLQLEAWYRCDIELEGGLPVQVYAIGVPADWKLDASLNEPVGFDGFFLKRGEASTKAPGEERAAGALIFAARRVAWFPAGLLGELDMDAGLFDTVRDRTRLSERECFYQLLAAVRRAPAGQIEAAGRRQIAELQQQLPKLLQNADLPPRQRTAARRALTRAERHASDVVPLFNQPELQRGKLFVVRGDALRAIEIRVTDPDIVARFGIDHYYEVELVTDDSQNHPIVCCVAELPADMPRGERIHVPVVVSGIFLKSWAYSAGARADDEEPGARGKRQLLAPLLVARSLRIVAAAPTAASGVATGVVVAVLLAAGCAALWWLARKDHGAISRARRGDSPLPERIALEGLLVAENDPHRDRQDAE